MGAVSVGGAAWPRPGAITPGRERRRYDLRGAVWLLGYLFFVLAPLFALLLGAHPAGRAFWTEFSIALGYAGLAMMGLQFGLTARFRYVTEPWGEDVIYHFMSIITTAMRVGITPLRDAAHFRVLEGHVL